MRCGSRPTASLAQTRSAEERARRLAAEEQRRLVDEDTATTSAELAAVEAQVAQANATFERQVGGALAAARGGRVAEPELDPLLASLSSLKLGGLKKRALALGATAAQMASVTDADDRKAAAIELILSIQAAKRDVLETRRQTMVLEELQERVSALPPTSYLALIAPEAEGQRWLIVPEAIPPAPLLAVALPPPQNDPVVEWMYADAGTAITRVLAQKNPLRWTRTHTSNQIL